MLVFHHLTVFKMADEQRALDQLVNINIRNGLQFFNRIDNLTVSNVGLAAREGDEETLKQLLARGKYFFLIVQAIIENRVSMLFVRNSFE